MLLYKDLSPEQKETVIAKMEELYLQKYSDQEIAINISEFLGDHFPSSAVRNWRRYGGLIKFNNFNQQEWAERFALYKAKASKEKEISLPTKERENETNKIRFDLYNQGYSDREIAAFTNTKYVNIKYWREANKLFKNDNKIIITGTVSDKPTISHNDKGDYYSFRFSYYGINKAPVLIEAIVRNEKLFDTVQRIREKTIIKITNGELYFEVDNDSGRQLIYPKILVYELKIMKY